MMKKTPKREVIHERDADVIELLTVLGRKVGRGVDLVEHLKDELNSQSGFLYFVVRGLVIDVLARFWPNPSDEAHWYLARSRALTTDAGSASSGCSR